MHYLHHSKQIIIVSIIVPIIWYFIQIYSKRIIDIKWTTHPLCCLRLANEQVLR